MSDEVTLKTLSGLGFGGILAYFGLSELSITIYGFVLVVDFILGIAEVYCTDKNKLQSDTAIKGLRRKLSRMILPAIVAIVLKGAGFTETDSLMSVIMGMLIVAEGYSIVGHIYNMNTGKKLPEVNGFEYVIDTILSVFKKKLESSAKSLK